MKPRYATPFLPTRGSRSHGLSGLEGLALATAEPWGLPRLLITGSVPLGIQTAGEDAGVSYAPQHPLCSPPDPMKGSLSLPQPSPTGQPPPDQTDGGQWATMGKSMTSVTEPFPGGVGGSHRAAQRKFSNPNF